MNWRHLAPLLLSAALDSQQPVPHASLTVEVPATAFAGQLLPLRLHIALDREFFATSAIQPFQQRLDLPIAVRADWLAELRGAELLPAPATDAPGATFALGTRLGTATAAGEELRDGRRFLRHVCELRLLVKAPGPFVLPATTLHWAWASRFDDSLLNGRQPADRHDEQCAAPPCPVDVQPLPVVGRPADFTGAIGVFTVAADCQPRELGPGDTARIMLTLRGDADLRFPPPPAPALPGLTVRGLLEDVVPGRRTFTWEVGVTGAIAPTLPPLRVATFDPEARDWRMLQTAPVPLAVRGGTAQVSLPPPPPPADDLRDIIGALDARARTRPVEASDLLLALAAPWTFALLLWQGRRLRARRLADPLGRRARGAAATFAATIARPGHDPATALTGYLAARLRCTDAAVVGPDLAQRIAQAGIAAPLAGRAAHTFAAVTAARYGGQAPAADVAALVRELEAAFLAQDGAR